MPPLMQRANHCIAAGALAGLVTTILIWGFSQAGMFARLGIPMAPDLTAAWIYQRSFWGGLWGPLFLLPLFRTWIQWKRGLIFGLAPGLVTLLLFNPIKDGIGILGLGFGPAWPVVVLAFAVMWGALAGLWLDWSGLAAGGGQR
jgi:hypothetical protein